MARCVFYAERGLCGYAEDFRSFPHRDDFSILILMVLFCEHSFSASNPRLFIDSFLLLVPQINSPIHAKPRPMLASSGSTAPALPPAASPCSPRSPAGCWTPGWPMTPAVTCWPTGFICNGGAGRTAGWGRRPLRRHSTKLMAMLSRDKRLPTGRPPLLCFVLVPFAKPTDRLISRCGQLIHPATAPWSARLRADEDGWAGDSQGDVRAR